VDPKYLDRTGLVKQALDRWFFLHPTDRHPTVDQLVSVSENLHRRTVQRGLKDLVALGEVIHIADPGHEVGRMTVMKPVAATAEPVAEPVTELSLGDNSVTPTCHPVTTLARPTCHTCYVRIT